LLAELCQPCRPPSILHCFDGLFFKVHHRDNGVTAFDAGIRGY
jgi:hypothetical protein